MLAFWKSGLVGACVLATGYSLGSYGGWEWVQSAIKRLSHSAESEIAPRSVADLKKVENHLKSDLSQFEASRTKLRTEMGLSQQRVAAAKTRSVEIQSLLTEIKGCYGKLSHEATGKVKFLQRMYNAEELRDQIDVLLDELAQLADEQQTGELAVDQLEVLVLECDTRARETKRHLGQMSVYYAVAETQDSLGKIDHDLIDLTEVLDRNNSFFSEAPVRDPSHLIKDRKRLAQSGARRQTVDEFLATEPKSEEPAAVSTPAKETADKTAQTTAPLADGAPEKALVDLQRAVRELMN